MDQERSENAHLAHGHYRLAKALRDSVRKAHLVESSGASGRFDPDAALADGDGCAARNRVLPYPASVGLSSAGNFAKFHHVLNRATWSARKLSQLLLALLLQHFDYGDETLVFGIDETIERRWGRRIKARGIYRDAVRSSGGHFVKASGLRWISLMWLVHIPWAIRVWALPVFTLLAPSQRYYADKARAHKTVLDWARQMVFQLRRWLPSRKLVLVADNSYAALEFLHACQSLSEPVAVVTRLRLDAQPCINRHRRASPNSSASHGAPSPVGPGSLEGGPLTHIASPAERPGNGLDEDHGRLVQQQTTHGRNHRRHGGLVSRRDAHCAAALGSHPRPGGQIQAASFAVHGPLG